MTRSRRRSTEPPTASEEDRRTIDQFVQRIRGWPDLQAVVLFGSFARGDVDRRSDIDLLLVLDREDLASARSEVAAILGELKPRREISPTLTNLRDLEPTFLRNVFREGRVLHGKLLLTPDHLALRPRVLISYDLSGKKATDKVHISRLVHGFRSRKTVDGKPRVYEYPGLRGRPDALLVSRSAIALRPGDAEELVAELDRRKVPYVRQEIFL